MATFGYDVLLKALEHQGVTAVFGMLGGTNVPWVAMGADQGTFKFVRTRHEEGAVNAAAGYARAAGTVGVCTVTRGPGFTNSINALVCARHDRAPVLLVVAESPATRENTTQNIDQRALCQVLSLGFNHVAAVQSLPTTLTEAVAAAERDGTPQVLSLADGILEDPCGVDVEESARLESERAGPSASAVKAAVDLMYHSKNPLVIAGRGAVLSKCHEDLTTLSGLLGARTASTLLANRFFSGYPDDLGLCGGWSPAVIREQLDTVDLVVSFGAALNDYTLDRGTLFEGRPVIDCSLSAAQRMLGGVRTMPLRGDAKLTAKRMIDEWNRRGYPSRTAAVPVPDRAGVRRSVLAQNIGHRPERGLDPRQVYVALDDMLPPDRVVVTDSGRTLGTLPSLVDARSSRRFLVARGYGSIGLGLGYAIGAATATRKSPVVLFCGDGGFMMASADLDAVRLNDLDLTVVIMNDEQLGSEVKYLAPHGLPHDVIRQPLPDIPALAAAFGGRGIVVRRLSDLMQIDLAAGGMTLIDVRIDPGADGRAGFGQASTVSEGTFDEVGVH